MVTPGTVSLMVGRSGSGGKRLEEDSAMRRIFPACTMALEAAIDEISTGMMPLATSLRHLRGRAIRHLDHAEVGALVEEPRREWRRARGDVDRVGQLAGVGLGVVDQARRRS